MSEIVNLRCASLPLDLESRPERAANGATRAVNDGVPTEAQVLILDTGSERAALIGADLIWFASDQAETLRTEIARRVKCERDFVSLCATHTHGTPNPDARFSVGQCSSELVKHLNARILALTDKALAAPIQTAHITLGHARVPGVSINRRREAWLWQNRRLRRRVQNLPNPSRHLDDRLTVLAFLSEASRQPLALVTHFTCHPVADPADRRGADFPGILRQELRSSFGAETPILFLQSKVPEMQACYSLALPASNR